MFFYPFPPLSCGPWYLLSPGPHRMLVLLNKPCHPVCCHLQLGDCTIDAVRSPCPSEVSSLALLGLMTTGGGLRELCDGMWSPCIVFYILVDARLPALCISGVGDLGVEIPDTGSLCGETTSPSKVCSGLLVPVVPFTTKAIWTATSDNRSSSCVTTFPSMCGTGHWYLL